MLPACRRLCIPYPPVRWGRIGIDLGGSDRKAAAVMDGETVYAEEVVWQAKSAGDLRYHYEGITAALRAAKGPSARWTPWASPSRGGAGGRNCRSSLFGERAGCGAFDHCGRELLRRAVREVCGDVPCVVCNDGDGGWPGP